MKQNGNEVSIEHLLGLILESFNINKQKFHGQTMNGVCCRRLLDNVDEIFDQINELGLSKLKPKDGCNQKKVELLTVVLADFHSLFRLMDVVFSQLRIIDPSPIEIDKTRKSISVLESLWRKLDLNITPKCHILFVHTINHIKYRNGLADLCEDFVEKQHQIGKRLSCFVAGMNNHCFCHKEMTKIRRQWLKNDPSIQKQVLKVNASSKRKLSNSLSSSKKTKSFKKKQSKRMKREAVMKEYSWFLCVLFVPEMDPSLVTCNFVNEKSICI